jgi:hypothetical protein
MNVQHILIDDSNPEHRELSICRTGTLNRVRLGDGGYHAYASLSIDGHDYAALFHYGIVEACGALPFISESGNGLDSWDEAYLPSGSLNRLRRIIGEAAGSVDPGKEETILLGWQDQPAAIAWLRRIEPQKFLGFIETLLGFIEESERDGYDLEFIL